MRPESQQIAIARLMGWKIENGFVTTPSGHYLGQLGFKFNSLAEVLPDYCNDLNEMHKAEEVFIQHDGCVWGVAWDLYCTNLAKICALATPPTCLCRAESFQRAAAFIQTFNKWVDDNNEAHIKM